MSEEKRLPFRLGPPIGQEPPEPRKKRSESPYQFAERAYLKPWLKDYTNMGTESPWETSVGYTFLAAFEALAREDPKLGLTRANIEQIAPKILDLVKDQLDMTPTLNYNPDSLNSLARNAVREYLDPISD